MAYKDAPQDKNSTIPRNKQKERASTRTLSKPPSMIKLRRCSKGSEGAREKSNNKNKDTNQRCSVKNY